MEKWHITITDNETGEKEIDLNTDAIIAGIAETDGVHELLKTHCSGLVVSAVVCGVEDVVEKAKAENPHIATVASIWRAEHPIGKKKSKSIKSIINNIFGRR